MQFITLLFTAFAIGAITPIYLPMNSSVAKYVGSPVLANVAFFLVALITTLIALTTTLLIMSGTDGLAIVSKFRSVPPHLYFSGALSALFILGTTFLIPRLGANTFFVLFVSGQVIMALAISHFGILESPQDPISLPKIIGVMFLITGVTITSFANSQEISWIPSVFKEISLNFWKI